MAGIGFPLLPKLLTTHPNYPKKQRCCSLPKTTTLSMRIQANEDDSPAIRKAKQKVNEKKEALKKASFFSKTTTLSMRIQANEDDSPAIRKAIEKVNEKKEAVKKARDARDKAMKDGKKSTEELGKYLSEVQEAERELTAAEEYLKELRRDKGY